MDANFQNQLMYDNTVPGSNHVSYVRTFDSTNGTKEPNSAQRRRARKDTKNYDKKYCFNRLSRKTEGYAQASTNKDLLVSERSSQQQTYVQ